jgi:dTDP-4-amino-4,6-dideoxygalactose transaminase
LKKLEKNLTKRDKLFNHYIKKLKYLPLSFQNFDKKKIRHGCHLFIVALNKNQKKTRDKLFLNLTSNKIGCGINYRSITDMSIFFKNLNGTNKLVPIQNI